MDDRFQGSGDAATRRDILALLASGAALTSGQACFDPPREKILPYVKEPPDVVPGVPLWFATSMVIDGYATGLLVGSREGRPIKIEGNPEHPASLGGTRAIEQASILGLYDPTRARGLTERGKPRSWDDFVAQVAKRQRRGGLRFLLPPQSSPLVGTLLGEIAAKHPDARFCFYAPLERGAAREAAGILYGDALEPRYDFRRARVVVALDADFTSQTPMAIRWARDFAAARRVGASPAQMGRFYSVEPGPTPTSTLADHRIVVRSVDVPRVAAALLAEVLAIVGPGRLGSDLRDLLWKSYPEAERPMIRAAAKDLLAARGAGVVVAGDAQPLETHVLAHLLNDALGNLGGAVALQPSALVTPPNTQSLYELAGDLQASRVDTLVVLDSNPIYDAPAGLDLRRALRSVPMTAHLGLHRDETSDACRWFLPESHYLESWGDARAYDGTTSFIQPLVAPLYETRTITSVLAAFTDRPPTSDYEMLRESWRRRLPLDFEKHWNENIQRGLIADSRLDTVQREPRWQAAAGALAALRDPAPPGIELHFEPSARVFDGRFATNPWLQELPHPLTKLTWGNAAVIGPGLAAELGLETGDLLEIRLGGQTLTLPALLLPGHANDSITVELGYGRRGADLPRDPIGADVYPLRSASGRHAVAVIDVKKEGGRIPLPTTQPTVSTEGRDVGLFATLESYRREPRIARRRESTSRSMLPVIEDPEPHQWAMTIDTMICTGCSACVIACQAENNVPSVGPEGVLRGREMQWLRIDRYIEEVGSRIEIINQPMLCQHCEKAPCEYVCPVNATVHSPDGLNEMVYNRCVGTRFCSNNCPYKVRRFNWLDIPRDPTMSLQSNPEVTVRERGVMEKCTFCVQRLRTAQRHARAHARDVLPDEVVTACQQACPTGAIAFGLLRDESSDVVRWRHEGRAYAALEHLGTRPRVEYLTKLTNPNPELD